jgi:thiol-disulfide isomerase/thioredoxin
LSNFSAGSGKGNAWSHLASVRPKLILTDALGHEWKPVDLSKKITFVTLWASWCGPCRAELPYVEKLYERFKGREDVVVLALNIDDDPKAMDPALKELRVTLPAVAARDFAYDIVPPMALPANRIITPSKSQIFEAPSDSLDSWLEKATKACEQANSQ